MALQGVGPPEGAAFLHVRLGHPDQERWKLEEGLVTAAARHIAIERERTAENLYIEVSEGRSDEDVAEGWHAARADFIVPDGLDQEHVWVSHLEARLARSYREQAEAFHWLLDHVTRGPDSASRMLILRPIGTPRDRAFRLYGAADMSIGSEFRTMYEADLRDSRPAATRSEYFPAPDWWRTHQVSGSRFQAVSAEDFAATSGGTGIPWDTEGLPEPCEFVAPTAPSTASIQELDWPGWASMPVMDFGLYRGPLIETVDGVNESQPRELDAMTVELLTTIDVGGWPPRHVDIISALADNDIEFDPAVTAAIETFEESAAQVASVVLEQPGTLRFELGHPNDWIRGRTPGWVARVGDKSRDLRSLSQAEKWWSSLAIQTALARWRGRYSLHAWWDMPAPVILLCDEPEQGLHRRAEHHLAAGLDQLAQKLEAPVLVATHSPALLNDLRTNILHVQQDPAAGTTAKPLTRSTRPNLERDWYATELGITPADLLQMCRVIVCVEGEHDRIVVERLLGDDLDAGAGLCVPIGGAKALTSVADASILFDFTSASIIVVLDNTQNEAVQPIWRRLVSADAQDDERGAQSALRDLELVDTGEGRWLRQFAGQAIKTHRLDRVTVHGLSQPDVICYLPSHFFIDGSESWEEPLAKWRSAARGHHPTDFKGWLRSQGFRGASVKVIGRAVDSVVAQAAALHPDLVSLGLRIRERSV
jgi:energy-coupling factor transporter ATP-binding protein EcfA2